MQTMKKCPMQLNVFGHPSTSISMESLLKTTKRHIPKLFIQLSHSKNYSGNR